MQTRPSAPSSTKDNTILSEIESNYGSWLEKLTPSQKSAWLIVLITEAVEPEGIEVDYSIDGIPQLKQLFKLTDGCKLDASSCSPNVSAGFRLGSESGREVLMPHYLSQYSVVFNRFRIGVQSIVGGVANVLFSLCKDLLQLASSGVTNSYTTPPRRFTMRAGYRPHENLNTEPEAKQS